MKRNYNNTIPIPDDVDTTIPLNEWSKITGIKLKTIKGRIKRGWTIEEALYRKVRFNKLNQATFDPKIHHKVGELYEGEKYSPLTFDLL